MALNPFKRKDSGPKYTCFVVSRDTFNQTEIGEEHKGRLVVEGFFDSSLNNYVLVTRPQTEQPA